MRSRSSLIWYLSSIPTVIAHLTNNSNSADGSHIELSQFEDLSNKIHAETVDFEQQLRQRERGVGYAGAQSHRPRQSIQQLRGSIRRSQDNEDIVRAAMAKADAQKRILDANIDAEALRHAFIIFENLEQIRLMRVHDGDDARVSIPGKQLFPRSRRFNELLDKCFVTLIIHVLDL